MLLPAVDMSKRSTQIVVAAAGVAGFTWYWLRRKTGQLRDLARLDDEPLPEGVVVLTEEEIFTEGVEALTLSWSGNPNISTAYCEPWMNWCCGTTLAKYDDPERMQVIGWAMRFFLEMSRNYGQTVLGTRDAETGKLIAVVAVTQYPGGVPTGWAEFTQFLGAAWRLWRSGHGFLGLTMPGFRERFEEPQPQPQP